MSLATKDLTIQVDKENAFSLPRTAVASIDTGLCINCGQCRRVCPTEAITEYQRIICRLCPDCANGPQFFPDEMEVYAREHACSVACPLGTVPEGYIGKIAEGKFEEAAELIAELNPLPGVCGRICNHPCMDACKRGLLIDAPLNIRGLKRFIADRINPVIKPFITRYDRKVAVIGAGPAGIMAAFDLARKGYKVTVFEAGPEPGGMMRRGIPSFRLDKKMMREEIAALEKAGIEIVYNTIIGKNPTVEDLFGDKYAAVIMAVGATQGMILPIEGADGDTVYDAVTLMEKINTNVPLTATGTARNIECKQAVIIGGGSVALDTARALLRLGADKVTCVCIEDDKSMPAMADEIEDARLEGVEFVTSAAPSRIINDWVEVRGVEFKKVSEIKSDAQGRLRPVTEDGTEFVLDADTVVFATGQKPELRFLAEGAGLELNAAGLLDYDAETLMTSREGLFLAGDAVTGRGSVIDAMASGRRAALMVDNMLQGRKLVQRVDHPLHTAESKEKIYPVRLEKLSPQIMPQLRDRDGFDEVEIGYSEQQAVLEAKRCMKCGFERVEESFCIGCGACATVCPQNAITMKKAMEEE